MVHITSSEGRDAQIPGGDDTTFRAFIEHAPDGVFVQVQGRFAYVNPATVRMLGATSATDLLGTSILDRCHPDDREVVRGRIGRLNEDRQPSSLHQHRFLRLDGSLLDAEVSAVPFVHDGENGALVFVRDVSARVRAEAEAREQAARAQQYLDIVGTIVVALHIDGTVRLINRAGCRALGYAESEIVGRNWFDHFLPPAIRDAMHVEFARLVGSRPPHAVEFFENPILTRAGDERLMAWHSALLTDAEGRVIGTLSSGADVTSDRQAAQTLEASRTQLAITLQSIGDAVIATDATRRITLLNSVAEALTGWSVADAIGRPLDECFQIVHGQTRAPADDPTVRVLAEGITVGLANDTLLIARDGAERQIADSAAPIRDASGAITGVVLVFRDVTAQYAARQALRASEERYRTLFERMLNGFALHEIICDDDGRPVDYRFLEVNPAYERLTGLRASDLIGRTVREVLPGIEDFWIETYGRVALTGEPAELESVAASLGRHYAVTAYSPKPGQFACIFADVSERVRAEEELRESEARFRSLAEGSPDYIMRYDREGRHTYMNAAGLRVSSLTPEDIIGKTHAESGFDAEQSAFWEAKIHAVFATGQPCQEQFTWEGAEGRMVLDWRLTPEFTDDGSVMSALGVSRDITGLVRAEEERLEMERRLLHAQKLESLGVLAGGIAHDFNNLLTAILGNLDLAQVTLPPSSGAHRFIEAAGLASRRAADLTRQMLAYSGKGRFAVRETDLVALVTENAEILRAVVPHTVTLTMHSGGDTPAIVADPSQIEQVVLNLITNAAEAVGSRPGAIVVATGPAECSAAYLEASVLAEKPAQGLFAYVEVRDTGCGMEPEVQARLFEPFFTTKFTGRGLGMAAVQGIVRAHEGAIMVESTPGKGTVIRVLFPVTVAEKAPVAEATPAGAPPTPDEALVLVVDDEPMVREFCRAALAQLGYRTIVASDGEEGVAAFRARRNEIDCVLLDLSMPRMDGTAAFAELRRICPDVRVILTSGFGEDVAEHFTGQGLAGFLEKPFPVDALRAMLARVLGG
jgi:PAS domain S-box-containing protein